jgi:hypothetical protein
VDLADIDDGRADHGGELDRVARGAAASGEGVERRAKNKARSGLRGVHAFI